MVRTWGAAPRSPFSPKPHWDLGASLGLFDLPAGVKITGSGFPLFTGMGARLGRALANFMLDLHTREHGYLEVAPPYLVNRATLTGTGQLPKFAEEVYASPADDLFLIPTAEVPVTNIHARRDSRGQGVAGQLRGLYPMLPAGGVLPRERHPRPDSSASVRQGGIGSDRSAGASRRRSTS